MATTELPLPALPEAHHEEPGGIVDWLTTVDHKKIGLLYVFTSFAIFLAGGILALLVRLELAGPGLQVMGENTYNQVFTMHGTLMIFLFAAQVTTGLANYFIPLHLGAADVAGYSFTVWAHHMFTTGQINLYWFSIMSFIIAVPTGIKVFNWLATMWCGSIWLTTAMLMVVGFLVVFVIGGITGVFLASAPIDFAVNDTYYVVAHFSYVMVGALLFGLFAGLYYWFRKMSGRLLSEASGRLHF